MRKAFCASVWPSASNGSRRHGARSTHNPCWAALLGQEKHTEAEPLLVAGYEGLKARQEEIPPPVRVQRLAEALGRLIALSTALNRPEDVQRWQAEKDRLSPTPSPK
jgi:hypothetical protein